jgi:hypothetical protein
MSALIQPAVDQHALAGALQQMTGTSNTAIGAVKGNFQAILLMLIVELQSHYCPTRLGAKALKFCV